MTPCQSLRDIVKGTAPGGDSTLQIPRKIAPNARSDSRRAIGSQTGELRVSQRGGPFVAGLHGNTVKFHRLHSSVPSPLWRWRTICGWPWSQQGFHINVLELQSVLTCLQWRICRKKHICCRFLHLTDSLVCLHALTRGRSSSRKLRAILSRINALLLAADCHPVWGYVNTKQNRADRAS